MVRAKAMKEGALLVQKRIRIILAKRVVGERRWQRRRLRAAIAIQGCQRRRVARGVLAAKQQEKREGEAALLIQCVVRGNAARYRVYRIKRDRVEMAAALLVQRQARRMNAKRRVKKMREERQRRRKIEAAAALKIQCVYRGYVARLETAMRLAGVRQMRKLRDRSAARLQAFARGMEARARCKRLREERDESLMNWARSVVEMASEDGGANFYQNSETAEVSWRPPADGYTRKDGMLVLATGKVIEDPLTTMTAEEKRAKLLEKKCTECQTEDATRNCEQCGDRFCTNCYNDTHKVGARARHTWSRLGNVECAECEKKDAIRWCVVCDDPFCAGCWEDMHRRGKRALHPFCKINEEGKLDLEAVTADGDAAGRYAVGPQERGGGDNDDGLIDGQIPEIEKDESEPEPEEEEEEQQEEEAAAAGAAAEGGWDEYADDQGYPYWVNNTTGESTYEDPTGGAGAGAADLTAAAAAAAGEEVAAG